jgi:hypothetical protein
VSGVAPYFKDVCLLLITRLCLISGVNPNPNAVCKHTESACPSSIDP